MYRILKPGGGIIIADGFQFRDAKNKKERGIIHDYLSGLAVFQFQWWDGFSDEMENAGFKNIVRYNMTDAVEKTSKYIWRMSFLFSPLTFLCWLFGRGVIMRGNWRAGLAQWNGFKKGLWKYGVFYAEKQL